MAEEQTTPLRQRISSIEALRRMSANLHHCGPSPRIFSLLAVCTVPQDESRAGPIYPAAAPTGGAAVDEERLGMCGNNAHTIAGVDTCPDHRTRQPHECKGQERHLRGLTYDLADRAGPARLRKGAVRARDRPARIGSFQVGPADHQIFLEVQALRLQPLRWSVGSEPQDGSIRITAISTLTSSAGGGSRCCHGGFTPGLLMASPSIRETSDDTHVQDQSCNDRSPRT
ncbi:hypothetical protein SAMN05519103_09674 [Rhizobiales bacterium GAS113]|nr:hypothetical protein SAMN05519103_09674 [Rhizobiales bacterium GAS113]